MTNRPSPTGYFTEAACALPDFKAAVERSTPPSDVPHASALSGQIPIYDGPALTRSFADGAVRRSVMAEWAQVLQNGAGVFAITGAQPDLAAIDDATLVYRDIIAREAAEGRDGADHFAGAGHNDRIWNALQKLCLAAPQVFVRYFASPVIDAACEAWLGPCYQMTAQVNQVRPGGAAQLAHRDYHLGFQTAAQAARYPAHVHELSAALTLQGGIAHCDMPVESGPTKLLPFSQTYGPGYAAWRRRDFRAYFEEHHVQLPLQKGDALFFNPALFHGAGSNVSADISRMVNLLQVSSAFGRAMESVDREAMCRRILPALQAAELPAPERGAVIAACAEGYPFPTNLDTDPPEGGLAPPSQQDILREAVRGGWAADALTEALWAQTARRSA